MNPSLAPRPVIEAYNSVSANFLAVEGRIAHFENLRDQGKGDQVPGNKLSCLYYQRRLLLERLRKEGYRLEKVIEDGWRPD